MRDPYLYPDTEVLKNLLGIRDSKKLQEAEGDYVTFRLSEIEEYLIFLPCAVCITGFFRISTNGQESPAS